MGMGLNESPIIRYLPEGKGRQGRKPGTITAICEPIVWKMSKPGRLTTLWTSTAYYRDGFTIITPWL
jgi:hypothetical protein